MRCDTGCRANMEDTEDRPMPSARSNAMLKNLLAAVGLIFVARKGYAHYQEYRALKQENEELQEQLAKRKAQPRPDLQ